MVAMFSSKGEVIEQMAKRDLEIIQEMISAIEANPSTWRTTKFDAWIKLQDLLDGMAQPREEEGDENNGKA